MQLTTINKIVSYLLVGSLATAFLIGLFIDQPIPKLIANNSTLISGASVILSVTFLSLAALVGCIIEGISSTWTRRILQGVVEKKRFHWILYIFGLSRDLQRYEFCRQQFHATLHQDNSKSYSEVMDTLDEASHSLATGLFFDKSKSDVISWVSSHYATYVLASGFLTLVSVAGPSWYGFASFRIGSQYLMPSILVWLISLYALISLSVTMYLYSYEVVFRQAYLIVKNSISVSSNDDFHACQPGRRSNGRSFQKIRARR